MTGDNSAMRNLEKYGCESHDTNRLNGLNSPCNSFVCERWLNELIPLMANELNETRSTVARTEWS